MSHTPGPCEYCKRHVELNGLRFTCDCQCTIECHVDDFPVYSAAPELLTELVGIVRCFERDNVPTLQESRPSGRGVRVFIKTEQIARITAAIAKARGQ